MGFLPVWEGIQGNPFSFSRIPGSGRPAASRDVAFRVHPRRAANRHGRRGPVPGQADRDGVRTWASWTGGADSVLWHD